MEDHPKFFKLTQFLKCTDNYNAAKHEVEKIATDYINYDLPYELQLFERSFAKFKWNIGSEDTPLIPEFPNLGKNQMLFMFWEKTRVPGRRIAIYVDESTEKEILHRLRIIRKLNQNVDELRIYLKQPVEKSLGDVVQKISYEFWLIRVIEIYVNIRDPSLFYLPPQEEDVKCSYDFKKYDNDLVQSKLERAYTLGRTRFNDYVVHRAEFDTSKYRYPIHEKVCVIHP